MPSGFQAESPDELHIFIVWLVIGDFIFSSVVQLKKRGRSLWCSRKNSECKRISWIFIIYLFFKDHTMTFFCFLLCKPSSTQVVVARRRQAADGQPVRDRWVLCFGLGPPVCPPVSPPVCPPPSSHWCSSLCIYPHTQDRGMESTAAPKSTSITAASLGRTSTRVASLSSLSSSARGTVSSYSKRWGGGWGRRAGESVCSLSP